MQNINDVEKTKSFVACKLVDAQLDSFRVYSLELQLNFVGDETDEGLRSYWLCITGNVSFFDGEDTYLDRADVVANLYHLLGEKITGVEIEAGGALLLYCDGKVVTARTDKDNLEVVWSLTPESPDPNFRHGWSVTLTDNSELVLSISDQTKQR